MLGLKARDHQPGEDLTEQTEKQTFFFSPFIADGLRV